MEAVFSFTPIIVTLAAALSLKRRNYQIISIRLLSLWRGDSFYERGDLLIRVFRLIVEHEHSRIGNLHKFDLRVFRHQRLPRIPVTVDCES